MSGSPPATDPQALGQPFVRLGPTEPITPLVIAVPHAGRTYPAEIDEARAVPHSLLEGLEDRHADLLPAEALAAGAVAIVAQVARAFIDLNRGEQDGRAEGATARARAGLGLVPARLGSRALWHAPPDAGSIAARLAAVHAPYHGAIAAALAAARARHGFALLIDCHSMPPLARNGAQGPRIVIGDRHGTSAAPRIAAAAVAAAIACEITVARNAPYAGAYTLDRHGRPPLGVHALQIETDRSLYLGAGLREPSAGLAGAQRLFARLAWAATEAAAPERTRTAAE